MPKEIIALVRREVRDEFLVCLEVYIEGVHRPRTTFLNKKRGLREKSRLVGVSLDVSL